MKEYCNKDVFITHKSYAQCCTISLSFYFAYVDVGDELETKCVGDNFTMLVTVSAILVTNKH